VTSGVERDDARRTTAGRVRPPVSAPYRTYNPTRRRQLRPIGGATGGGMSGPGESPDRDWSRRLVAGDEQALREV
jgi:hypothetical protein